MSKEPTKNTKQTSSEEWELKLKQYLEGEITATAFLEEEDEYDSNLKDAVLALARRNVKQGKA